ncbi:MAG: phospholipase D family protein [Ramlibacter sp.]|nr:phospholipase D family protein [Ramlibacter sp.]
MLSHPTLRPARPSRPGIGRWLTGLALVVVGLLTGCASLPSDVQRPVSNALATPGSTLLGQWVSARKAAARARSDSAFFLLDSEDLAFNARVALIDGAQKTLDLQYYAIHADSSTEILLEHLRQAARRGVRVRLLLDDLNTVGRDAQVLRLAFEPNVQIRLFNPLPGNRASLFGRLLGSLHEISQLQKRMHNKLFLSDNALGIIGGRNLGDAYFGQDKTSNFVDIDVLTAGRIVADMSASFDSYWNNEQAYPVQSLVSGAELDALRQPPNAALADTPQPPAPPAPPAPAPAAMAGSAANAALTPTASVTAGTSVLPDVTPSLALEGLMNLQQVPLVWAPSVLLADQPGKIAPEEQVPEPAGTAPGDPAAMTAANTTTAKTTASAATTTTAEAGATVIDGMLTLMDQARHDLLIISPYFVPGEKMMKRFEALRARGVTIRVLTNSLASNDAPAAHAGYARYRPALLAMGVELHEMRANQQGNFSGLGSTGSSRPGASGTGSVGSRASLHSKAVIADDSLLAIGSMNLDLRSRLQNTEVALLVRSRLLARKVIALVNDTLATGAYRVVQQDGRLLWQAPPGAAFQDARSEPDASTGLKLLVNLIGPFAPDEML